MKKSGSFLLFWAALIFLLSGVTQVRAYAPPLAASASFSSSSVTLNVWDPMRETGIIESIGLPPGATVVSLKQHNGLIAWVVQDGSTYYITFCTYDPPRGQFVMKSLSGFSYVNHFAVADGVIVWVSNQYVHALTYDPEVPLLDPGSSPWKLTSHHSPNLLSVLTADGVVAWTRIESPWFYAGFCVYHPGAKVWNKGEEFQLSIDPFYIFEATVFIGGNNYGLKNGVWLPNAFTDSIAYFVAQPTSGKAPLWVWFTDLSIAPTSGTIWYWSFGDGTTNVFTSRHSSYHTYQKGRVYTALLNIYNGQPPTKATITVYPINLTFLPLLLLD